MTLQHLEATNNLLDSIRKDLESGKHEMALRKINTWQLNTIKALLYKKEKAAEAANKNDYRDYTTTERCPQCGTALELIKIPTARQTYTAGIIDDEPDDIEYPACPRCTKQGYATEIIFDDEEECPF